METDDGLSRLAAATEALNEALEEAEDALASLRMTVHGQVEMDGGRLLSFRKVGDRWGLYFSSSSSSPVWQELLRQSRSIRAEAAVLLPDLLDSMGKNVFSQAEAVELAARAAAEFAASVRSRAP